MEHEAELIHRLTPWAVGMWLLALFAAEWLKPLRSRTRPALRRFVINGLAVLLAFGTAAVTVGPAIMAAMSWSHAHGFGLLRWLQLPAPLTIVAGVLLLDMSFYYWHRLNHVVPVLWRFHNVHHLDPDLDCTTSFRFHFGEIAYSAVFRVVQIALIGPNAVTLAVFEALFLAATVFHHSNVRLPIRVERVLNKVFVTPRMHGIHHSVIHEETNSNYSVIFRWWDALNRTLRVNVSPAALRIGVAGYAQPGDNSLGALLALPFRKQRPYWRLPNGDESEHRKPGPAAPRGRMVE